MGDEIPSEAYKVKCPGCGHRNLEGRVLCFGCGKRLGGGYAMTTEGEQSPAEQKEAVCGTCGERLIWSAITQTWRHAVYPGHMPDVRTATVPAPVVPSDDERCDGCGHGQHGSPCGWLLSDDIEDECGCVKYAPPTPSQAPTEPSHAEGDGRKALLLRIKRMTGREPVGVGDLLNILTHPDCIEFTEAWLESAIREPYEELVSAARDLRSYAAIPSTWRDEFFDARDRLDAALTSIEESHQ